MNYSEYTKLPEEELIELAKKENNYATEILIEKHIKMLYGICQNYYARGADRDDFIQIALISFHKSIFNYKKTENSLSFRNFAALCVRREVISFLKHTNSQKNELLNNAVPIYSHIPFKREDELEDDVSHLVNTVLRDHAPSPEDIVIEKEIKELIEKEITSKLSELEKKVLSLKIRGYTYKEISQLINRKEKAIDNSIQRMKKKFENIRKELKAI